MYLQITKAIAKKYKKYVLLCENNLLVLQSCLKELSTKKIENTINNFRLKF
jgi:hypothetical protein